MQSFLHLYSRKMEPIQEQILVGRQEEMQEVKLKEGMQEVKLKEVMLEEDKKEEEEKPEDRQVDKEII